jgi:hypothetical protein
MMGVQIEAVPVTGEQPYSSQGEDNSVFRRPGPIIVSRHAPEGQPRFFPKPAGIVQQVPQMHQPVQGHGFLDRSSGRGQVPMGVGQDEDPFDPETCSYVVARRRKP